MNTRAQIRLLEDGRRLHLNDGPIDLIIEAFGETDEVGAAYRAAAQRFVTVLDELCDELTFLRQAARIRRPAPVRCHREAHGGGGCALLRADFHHAHGGSGGRSRGGNSGRHDGGRQALAGLRKQWRRHRAASRPRRAFCRRHGGAAGPSIAFRNRDARLSAASAGNSDQRLARPQLLARHRRRGYRAGRPRGDGGRRRNHHRQRRGPAGASQHCPRARSHSRTR